MNKKIFFIIFFLIAVCLLIAGFFMIGYFPNKFKSEISEKVVIIENSEAFNNWKNPPASLYIDFYFFNVTNYEQFINFNEKPIVQEIGPYVYREIREKKNITFSENGSLIYYDEYKTYYFDTEKSNGKSDNDSFYTINIPLLTIFTWAKDHQYVLEPLAPVLSEFGETLFEKRSVNELLWGYDLVIFEKINEFLAKFDLHFNFPKFALYSGADKNGSSSGRYSIVSGLKDIKSVATIQSLNNQTILKFWPAKSCNQINGTDGTQFSPFLDESSILYLFNADICRSVHAVFESHSSVSSSYIPTLRFIPPPDVMQDHKKNPDNACFCTPNVDFCLGSGVLNVSTCKGAPLVISQPHFYEADSIYINAISGIKPLKEKHQTSLDVEPNTGYVMQASKKVQINIYLQKVNFFRDLENLNRSYIFPIVWGNEHALINDDEAARLKTRLVTPMRVVNIVQYLLLAIASVIIVAIFVVKLGDCVKKSAEIVEVDENSPLLSSS